MIMRLVFIALLLPGIAGAQVFSDLGRCKSLDLTGSQWVTPERAEVYQAGLEQGLYQQVQWALHDDGDSNQSQVVAECLDQIMHEGQVRSIERLGGGISATYTVQLPYRVAAVFKTTNSFDGCYPNELAAYLLDQRLDFQTVPMTILRTIDGKKGSLQYFINDAVPAHLAGKARKTVELKILDLLIDNEDRHAGNWLFYEFEGNRRLVAIDHNLSFGCRAQANLSVYDIKSVPPEEAVRLKEKLQGLTYEELKALFEGLIKRTRSIRKTEKARLKIIRRLEKLAQAS